MTHRPDPPPIPRSMKYIDVASSNANDSSSTIISEPLIETPLIPKVENEATCPSESTVAPERVPPATFPPLPADQKDVNESLDVDLNPQCVTVASGSTKAVPKPGPPTPTSIQCEQYSADTVTDSNTAESRDGEVNADVVAKNTPFPSTEHVGVSHEVSTARASAQGPDSSCCDDPVARVFIEYPAEEEEGAPSQDAANIDLDFWMEEDIQSLELPSSTAPSLSPQTLLSSYPASNTLNPNQVIFDSPDSLSTLTIRYIESLGTVEKAIQNEPSPIECDEYVWTGCCQHCSSLSARTIIPLGQVYYPTSNERQGACEEMGSPRLLPHRNCAIGDCALMEEVWNMGTTHNCQDTTSASCSYGHAHTTIRAVEVAGAVSPPLEDEEFDLEDESEYKFLDVIALDDYVHLEMFDDEPLVEAYIHPQAIDAPQLYDNNDLTYGIRDTGKYLCLNLRGV